MLSILLFLSVSGLTNATEPQGAWDTDTTRLNHETVPLCKRLKYNSDDYEGFSLPIDFYAVTEKKPFQFDARNYRELSEMKKLYNVLPNARTDVITFYGSTTKPNVEFTMTFGETDDQLSYYLEVIDSTLYLQHSYNTLRTEKTAVKLPENFGIEVEFAVDGVLVTLYDTTDDENHVVVNGPTCTLYRGIPTGISYMAVFMDCESVEFESITMLTFLQKPTLYHMHVPHGRGDEYRAFGILFTSIYTGFSAWPYYNPTGGNMLLRRTVLTGFVQCRNVNRCIMAIFGTYLVYDGENIECPVQQTKEGIWFLCTEVVGNLCIFDENVLESAPYVFNLNRNRIF